MREDTRKFLKDLFKGSYQASSIGLVLSLSILIGFGIGYWLSTVFNNNIFIFIGLIVGIIAGFREVYRMGKKFK